MTRGEAEMRDSPAGMPRSGVMDDALKVYRMDPGLALHRAAEAALLRELELRGPILDLGCHDGGFAWLSLRAAAEHTDIVGADRELGALARCRVRGVHRSVAAVDATRLPFGDGVFGSVLCNSVLTHIPDLDCALTEIARVLQPDGILAATVPTPAFREFFAPVRALTALGLRNCADRVGSAYDRAWHQHHFLGEPAWRVRLLGAGMSLESWNEYLDSAGSMLWSSLFLLARTGAGRYTIGALLRRMLRDGSAGGAWMDERFARSLAPALAPSGPGGSSLFVARKIASAREPHAGTGSGEDQ